MTTSFLTERHIFVIIFTVVKMGQDYYAVLGLTRRANDADIKKSYVESLRLLEDTSFSPKKLTICLNFGPQLSQVVAEVTS